MQMINESLRATLGIKQDHSPRPGLTRGAPFGGAIHVIDERVEILETAGRVRIDLPTGDNRKTSAPLDIRDNRGGYLGRKHRRRWQATDETSITGPVKPVGDGLVAPIRDITRAADCVRP